MYHQRAHSPSPSHGLEYLMPKTRGHSSGGQPSGGHYGPIPPYSGYPGYPYPSSHQIPYGAAPPQPHPGFHRPPPEETSPPPVYEYLSNSRPGKENFSSKFRLVFKSYKCPRLKSPQPLSCLTLPRLEFPNFVQLSIFPAKITFMIIFSDAFIGYAGLALEFGSSVNPIPTKGGRICPPLY